MCDAWYCSFLFVSEYTCIVFPSCNYFLCCVVPTSVQSPIVPLVFAVPVVKETTHSPLATLKAAIRVPVVVIKALPLLCAACTVTVCTNRCGNCYRPPVASANALKGGEPSVRRGVPRMNVPEDQELLAAMIQRCCPVWHIGCSSFFFHCYKSVYSLYIVVEQQVHVHIKYV